MKFDPSGMNQAFDKMRKQAQVKGKDFAEEQGGFFLAMARKFGWQAAPTRQQLLDKAISLKWRLRRKPGVTAKKELARRQRARGTFAKGWVITKITQSAYVIRVWIGNAVSYAGIVDEKKKTAEKAATVVGGKFKERLNRLAKAITSVFT